MQSTLSARQLLAWLGLATAIFLSGCAQMATYNPQLVVPPGVPTADKLPGQVLVFTDKADDETPFVGAPTSFTGGGSKLTIQLGVFAREIAGVVFGDLFAGGAVKANTMTGAERYRVVVHPKVVSYTYEYNQLKNAGFAVTPTVVVSLEVRQLDGSGKLVRSRTYQSGTVEGPAYMVTGSPGEEIGKVTHKALLDLMTKAAADIRSDMKSQPGGAKARDL